MKLIRFFAIATGLLCIATLSVIIYSLIGYGQLNEPTTTVLIDLTIIFATLLLVMHLLTKQAKK